MWQQRWQRVVVVVMQRLRCNVAAVAIVLGCTLQQILQFVAPTRNAGDKSFCCTQDLQQNVARSPSHGSQLNLPLNSL